MLTRSPVSEVFWGVIDVHILSRKSFSYQSLSGRGHKKLALEANRRLPQGGFRLRQQRIDAPFLLPFELKNSLLIHFDTATSLRRILP